MAAEEDDQESGVDINTDGGAYIGGDVAMPGGDFTGRDKTVIIQIVQGSGMLDPNGMPILSKTLDFLFGEGNKILAERRERQKEQPSKPLQPAEQAAPEDLIASKTAALGSIISETNWSANREKIQHLLNLRETYIRNYHLAKEQYAKHGSAYVPPIIVHNLNEAEQNIAATMKALAEAMGSVYNKKFVIEEIDAYEP